MTGPRAVNELGGPVIPGTIRLRIDSAVYVDWCLKTRMA